MSKPGADDLRYPIGQFAYQGRQTPEQRRAVMQMDELTQQNAALVEQLAQALGAEHRAQGAEDR